MSGAVAPGGKPIYVAKLLAEQLLWGRVRTQKTWYDLRRRQRPLPSAVPASDVLGSRPGYERAVRECRQLGLPPHHDRPKNWDALGAVSTILHELGTDIRLLDAGAARYSSILPWLYLYGCRELLGTNLEFRRHTRHGPVRYEPGDVTATSYRDGWFDAITCMSVIEHGVPLDRFAAEAARFSDRVGC